MSPGFLFARVYVFRKDLLPLFFFHCRKLSDVFFTQNVLYFVGCLIICYGPSTLKKQLYPRQPTPSIPS